MAVRIVYSGDEAAAHQHLPAAQNLLHKTRTQAATSGAGVTGATLFLAPGVYTYTLKIRETEVIFIHADPVAGLPTSRKLTELPDFLSGATRDAEIFDYKRVVDGQDVTTKLFQAYKPTLETAKFYDLPSVWQTSERLAVTPSSAVVDGGSDAPQLQMLVPSMYSGRMRALVQVLLGYGKIATDEGEAEVAVEYDYRWHRTHIIHKGDDGQLWLVEISVANGVIAMPLPVYEDSLRLKDSDREPIARAVTEFDGLPTGQPFPSGQALEDALLSGDVLQLLARDALDEFYRMQPFTTVHGWTTNKAGSDAYNIGWYFGNDGVRRSRLFWLQIKIGAVATERAQGQPLARGQAIIRRKESAKYYHPSSRKPPPFKVYEPAFGALLSVEFIASLSGEESTEPDIDLAAGVVEYDAPLWAAFVNEQLHLVRYNWNPNPRPKDVSSSDGKCRFNGTAQIVINTYSGARPTFYSVALESRSTHTRTVEHIVKAGKFLVRANHFSVDTERYYYPQWYSQWRDNIWVVRTDRKVTMDAYSFTAVVAPEGLRDGYVITNIENTGTVTKSFSSDSVSVRDPYAYNTFEYFYAGMGNSEQCWTQFGRKMREYAPTSIGGTYGYTDNTGATIIYNLSECRALVDEGEWLKPCQNAPMVSGPAAPRGVVGPITTEGAKTIITPYLIVDCGGTTQLTLPAEDGNEDVWTIKSPDPDTNIPQNMSARFSAFGLPHAAYQNQPDGEMAPKGALIAGEGQHKFNFLGVL